jgi:hypothetical protein
MELRRAMRVDPEIVKKYTVSIIRDFTNIRRWPHKRDRNKMSLIAVVDGCAYRIPSSDTINKGIVRLELAYSILYPELPAMPLSECGKTPEKYDICGNVIVYRKDVYLLVRKTHSHGDYQFYFKLNGDKWERQNTREFSKFLHKEIVTIKRNGLWKRPNKEEKELLKRLRRLNPHKDKRMAVRNPLDNHISLKKVLYFNKEARWILSK